MLVFQGCRNKAPQTEWLKQRNSVFLQFWRPEVWGHGVGRAGVLPGCGPWLVMAVFFLCLTLVFPLFVSSS